MRKISFAKYHGAGNDFSLIDNRNAIINLSEKEIAFLCNRRLGIGADGLMLLEKEKGFDFKMRYYNADGKEATMCGNGGRCIVAFANKIGIKKEKYQFIAVDGEHLAHLKKDIVNLKMTTVNEINTFDTDYFLDTGSPHLVRMVKDIKKTNVYEEGKHLRYDSRFGKDGCNVNFIQIKENKIDIRTYERGVEAETLACGTGAVASAIAANQLFPKIKEFELKALGGTLKVRFEKNNDKYTNIWLQGPATFVFDGELSFKN